MPKIFYHTATDEAIGAYNATEEKAASLTPPPGSTDTSLTGIGTAGELILTLITPANEPNEAGAWPSDVQVDIDIPSMDSTLEYGFKTIGNADGGFARVSADGSTEVAIVEQVEDPFATPGLKTCTFPALPAGDVTDRGVAVLGARKTFGHGNDGMNYRADGDGLISGGWAGGVPAGPIGVVLGTTTQASSVLTSIVTVLALTMTNNSEIV